MTHIPDIDSADTVENLMHDIVTPLVTAKMNAQLIAEHLIPLLTALKNSQSPLLPADENVVNALLRAPEVIRNNLATVQQKHRSLSSVLFEEKKPSDSSPHNVTALTSVTNTPTASPATLSIRNILLVEDEIIHHDIAMSLLSDTYQLDAAKNGIEAIDKCQNQTYDLILMDLQMPKMNGVTATEELRKFIPRDTIIVGLTSMPLGEKQASLLEIGFNDFLEKPLKLEDFKQLLKKLNE